MNLGFQDLERAQGKKIKTTEVGMRMSRRWELTPLSELPVTAEKSSACSALPGGIIVVFPYYNYLYDKPGKMSRASNTIRHR